MPTVYVLKRADARSFKFRALFWASLPHRHNTFFVFYFRCLLAFTGLLLSQFTIAQTFSEPIFVPFDAETGSTFEDYFFTDVDGDGTEDIVTDAVAVHFYADGKFDFPAWRGRQVEQARLHRSGDNSSHLFGVSKWHWSRRRDTLFWYDQNALLTGADPLPVWTVEEGVEIEYDVADADGDGIAELIVLEHKVGNAQNLFAVLLQVNWEEHSVKQISGDSLPIQADRRSSLGFIHDLEPGFDELFVFSGGIFYRMPWDGTKGGYAEAVPFLDVGDNPNTTHPFVIARAGGKYAVYGTRQYETNYYQLYPGSQEGDLPPQRSIPYGGSHPPLVVDLDADGDLDLLSTNGYAGIYVDDDHIYSRHIQLDGSRRIQPVSFRGQRHLAVWPDHNLFLRPLDQLNLDGAADRRFKPLNHYHFNDLNIYDLDGKGGEEMIMNYGGEVRIISRGDTPGSYRSKKVEIQLPEGRDNDVVGIDVRDMDGDGDQDLIVLFHEWGNGPNFVEVSVLYNEGGRFGSIPEPYDTIPAGLGGNRSIIDIHRDGHFDYHYGSTFSSQQVYVQRADTAYLVALDERYPGGEVFTFRDYDGDGWVDLFVEKRSGTDPYLKIYLNRAGTFADEPISFAQTKSYFAADLDGNGTLEIIYKPQTDPVTYIVFYDRETGSIRLDDRLGFMSPAIVDAGDYDGDGKFDLLRIVRPNYSDPKLDVRYGSDGVWRTIFTDKLAQDSGKPIFNLRTIDFDQDGQRELLLFSGASGSFSDATIYEADPSDGSLQPKIRLSRPRHRKIGWVDVNGDGLDDLLYHDESGTAVQPTETPYSPNAPSFNLRHRPYFRNPLPTAAQPADINGNGYGDLVVQYASDILQITEFTPEGFRTLQEFTHVPANKAILSDIDRDGRPDIGISGSSYLRFHRNRGGAEGEWFSLFPAAADVVVNLSDSLDRIEKVLEVSEAENGDPRFLVYGAGKLYSLVITSSWKPVVQRLLPGNELSGSIYYEDVTAGGGKEIIVSSRTEDFDWTYALPEQYPLVWEDRRLLWHGTLESRPLFDDFDRDGDLDIVGKNYLLTQTGSDTTLRLSILPKELPIHLMNLDGQAPLDWDLGEEILLNDANTSISPAENLTFSPSRAKEQYTDSYSVRVGDMNSDGVADLILSDPRYYGINWMPGRYVGANSVDYGFPRPVKGLFNFPKLLEVADFDNDGNSDLLYCIDGDYGSNSRLEFNGTECYVGLKGRTDSIERHVPVSWPDWVAPNVADYDQDGDMDIGSRTAFLVNRLNEGGAFNISTPDGVLSRKFTGNDRLADLDGDGDLDRVSLYFYKTDCRLELSTAWRIDEFNFSPLETLYSYTADWCYESELAGIYDYDRDGDADVLIALSRGFKKVELLLVAFEDNVVQRIEPILEASWAQSVDINENGIPELLLGLDDSVDWADPQQVAVHMDFREGSASRKPWQMNNYPHFPRHEILLRDLNGDGARDLLVQGGTGRTGGKRPFISLNEGTGPEITARILLDKDRDGRGDEGEPLRGLALHLANTGDQRFSGPTGEVVFPVREGSYSLEWVPHPLWELTPTTPPRQMASSDQSLAQIPVFAVWPRVDTVLFDQSIVTDPTRCGFRVRAYYNFRNAGTRDLDSATYYLVIPPQIAEFTNILPQPSRTSGDTVFFRASAWRVTEEMHASAELRMPGIEMLPFGSTLRFASGVITPQGQEHTHELLTTVTCAYDPNDKAANPDRGGEESYLLFDEWIYYTIRFQNTGNDTAFTVVLEDELDASLLDVGTFTMLQATHACETIMTDAGKVTFTFNNIMLPDSNRNELESHGAVQFKIRPREGLPDNTRLENTAAIYFDFNPPIITNTVINTLVEELPTSTGEAPAEALEGVNVFPNPAASTVSIDISTTSKPVMLWIYDARGKVVRRAHLDPGLREVAVDLLPPGPYLFHCIDTDGRKYQTWIMVQH